MTRIETPLLITGRGPAPLVVAKLVSGHGLPSLIAGHEPSAIDQPVQLTSRSLSILEPHGVLGVLRPYASVQDPFTITPDLFEQGLKHHCVVDMLVTVYDGMTPSDLAYADGNRTDGAVTATLRDGSASWELCADAFFDTGACDTADPDLNEAIAASARFADHLLASLR